MTDKEIDKKLDEMEKRFGVLPNPIQEPIRFRYYVKLWEYYQKRESGEIGEPQEA